MATKKQVLERWFWDYAGAFKARELFRDYSPPEGSTYTGIEMDRDPRFNPF